MLVDCWTHVIVSWWLAAASAQLLRAEPVGERLAQAAMGVVYGSPEAYAGPTISGCSVTADTITVSYNSTLLRGGAVGVKPYDQKSAFSAFRVLVDPHYWCSKTAFTVPMLGHQNTWYCDGKPVSCQCGFDTAAQAGAMEPP